MDFNIDIKIYFIDYMFKNNLILNYKGGNINE